MFKTLNVKVPPSLSNFKLLYVCSVTDKLTALRDSGMQDAFTNVTMALSAEQINNLPENPAHKRGVKRNASGEEQGSAVGGQQKQGSSAGGNSSISLMLCFLCLYS